MACWITFRKGADRKRVLAADAKQALEKISALRKEGWEPIKILDGDNAETSEAVLRLAVESAKVESS